MRDPALRNHFLDAVPEEVLATHRHTLGTNAFFFPELTCRHEDRSLFARLRREIAFQPAWLDNGMPFKRHICLGSDSLLASSPAFKEVVERLTQVFSIEPVRSLVNLYRDGGDWCNLHSDQYDAGHCGINFTIGASFGEERVLIFKERSAGERRGGGAAGGDARKSEVSIKQRNGDVHAFGQPVNEHWRHGVPRCEHAMGERISIMLWGYRGEDEAPVEEVRLTGTFPHLLHYDPKRSRTPRVCEGCDETKPQLGGKVDPDHRWCCAECWAAHDALGWKPRGAEIPSGVTDCLTVRGAQLAVAVLAGRKTVEFRKVPIPDGWYALHISKRPIEPWEGKRVEEQWPTAPKEQELPHEAVVGVVELSRLGGELTEASPWTRPGICYAIMRVVALRRTLPARAPGSSGEPWRLSPAARRVVASLIEGMPVYENKPPTTVAAASGELQNWGSQWHTQTWDERGWRSWYSGSYDGYEGDDQQRWDWRESSWTSRGQSEPGRGQAGSCWHPSEGASWSSASAGTYRSSAGWSSYTYGGPWPPQELLAW